MAVPYQCSLFGSAEPRDPSTPSELSDKLTVRQFPSHPVSGGCCGELTNEPHGEYWSRRHEHASLAAYTPIQWHLDSFDRYLRVGSASHVSAVRRTTPSGRPRARAFQCRDREY